jgi:hypothetical protein
LLVKNKFLLLALMLLAATTLSGCILSTGQRSGPEFVFPLQTTPPFLSEELAVEMARATLAVEGYNVEQWQLTNLGQSGRGRSPDGTRDRYLVRYQDTYGRVSFINGKHTRTYDVSLQGSRVVCRVFRGL